MPAFPNSFYKIADKAVGTLNADISSSATTLDLNTGEGGAFPTGDFCVRLESEIIYVGSRSTDSFTSLTRGYAGTTAAAHVATKKIRLPWMKEYYDRITSNLTGHTHVRADITDFSHTHPQGDITNLVSDLAAKEDDANKNVANGYCGLDAGIRVPTARLGSGTADSTTFLRGDQSWAVPSGGGGGTTITVARLTANQSTTGTTPVNLTDLAVTLSANTNYIIKGNIAFETAATTTGLVLSWTTGATITSARYNYLTGDIAAVGVFIRSFTAATTEAIATGSLGTTDSVAKVYVLVRVGATGGTLTLRFRSEVSGSNVTVFADSWLESFTF